MKSLKEIGCSLIGWNPAILKECGEASQRQFRKLLSAICIMMVLWGTILLCRKIYWYRIYSFQITCCSSIYVYHIVR